MNESRKSSTHDSDLKLRAAEDYFRLGMKARARGDWLDAAEAFLEAICRQSDPPSIWLFRFAGALMKLKDFRSAQLAYKLAISRDEEPPPVWFFDLGITHVRLREWQAAADSFTNAVARHEEAPAAWLYRLGVAQERLKEWDGASRSYEAALSVDPEATELDWRLLKKEPQEFQGRRMVARFLEDNLDAIRDRAAKETERTDDKSDTIFALWMQGIENAPPVVQACHRQLIRSTSRPVVYLDATTLPDYVQLPSDISAIEMGMQHRSDLLRIELLARYGGTWLDATCLVRDDFDDRLKDLSDSGFFAFAKRKATLSNWLLSVDRPSHYLILMLREALHAYWRRFGRMKRYYDFHYLFEGLVELDPDTRRIWDATPKIPHHRAHTLQRRKFAPYNEEKFREYIDEAFVQKLTYRYPSKRAREDTMLGHVLRAY
jgi:tetratricopeptide (TPR) repeat protein